MSEKLKRAEALLDAGYYDDGLSVTSLDTLLCHGMRRAERIDFALWLIEEIERATPSPSQPIDGREREAVLERILRRRIADLEGVLRYLKAQAVSGTLHPQVVIQNVDMALRGIRAALPAQTPWRDMDCAPKERPIAVRMPLLGNYRVAKYWIGTAILHEHSDHWTGGASIIHYNGQVLQPGFRGPFTHWCELDALPSPPKAEPKDEEA